MYAKPIQNLTKAFSRLPGVGQRTAERFVFALLRSGKKDVAQMTLALKELIEQIKSCDICWNFSDSTPCHVCKEEKRDTKVVCVIELPQNLEALERSNVHQGRYHVLRGTLDPTYEKNNTYLKIKELLVRIDNEHLTEVILALNPDLRGETTMMFLEKKIKEHFPDLTISRLARGLPMGSDILYADEMTLQSAFKHRRQN